MISGKYFVDLPKDSNFIREQFPSFIENFETHLFVSRIINDIICVFYYIIYYYVILHYIYICKNIIYIIIYSFYQFNFVQKYAGLLIQVQ